MKTCLLLCILCCMSYAETWQIRPLWSSDPVRDDLYNFKVCTRELGDQYGEHIGYDIEILDGWTATVGEGVVHIRKGVQVAYWINGTSSIYHTTECRYVSESSNTVTNVDGMRICKVCERTGQ